MVKILIIVNKSDAYSIIRKRSILEEINKQQSITFRFLNLWLLQALYETNPHKCLFNNLMYVFSIEPEEAIN